MFDINIKFYDLYLLGLPQFCIFSKMWIPEFLYLLSLESSEESFYLAHLFLTGFIFGKRCYQQAVKVLLRVKFCLPSHLSRAVKSAAFNEETHRPFRNPLWYPWAGGGPKQKCDCAARRRGLLLIWCQSLLSPPSFFSVLENSRKVEEMHPSSKRLGTDLEQSMQNKKTSEWDKFIQFRFPTEVLISKASGEHSTQRVSSINWQELNTTHVHWSAKAKLGVELWNVGMHWFEGAFPNTILLFQQ